MSRDCIRVLVTLLRGLGPWRESVFLVGGLTPRYLVTARPPEVPKHAGTLDIDLVVDRLIFENTEAYQSFAKNLKRLGFERSKNEDGVKLSWRWQIRIDSGSLVLLEFLRAREEKKEASPLQCPRFSKAWLGCRKPGQMRIRIQLTSKSVATIRRVALI